jgi:hypothetical protein
MKILISFILLFGSSALLNPSFADPVFFVGDQTNVQRSVDEKTIATNDLCLGIQTAEKLGNPIYLFTPDVTCNGKTYPGLCGPEGCTKNVLQKKLVEAVAKIPSTGDKPNLLIQTVGHGVPKTEGMHTLPPEYNILSIRNKSGEPSTDLSANEFGAMLQKSGVFSKVGTTRGLFTQCYSGGWNELARIVPRFCSVSQSTAFSPTEIVESESELNRTSFVTGFWSTLKQNRKATLEESTVQASLLLRQTDPESDPKSCNWRASSRYLAAKSAQTNEFKLGYLNSRESFSDGYSLKSSQLLATLQDEIARVSELAQETQNRYAGHLTSINEYNDSWYHFKKKEYDAEAFLMRKNACFPASQNPLNSISSSLVSQLNEVSEKLEQAKLNQDAAPIQAKIKEWTEKLKNPTRLTDQQTAALQAYFNEYLGKMGKLTLAINKDPSKYSEYNKQLETLKAEMKNRHRIAQFPALREYFAIEHEVASLKVLNQALNSKIPTESKRAMIKAWDCENSSIFKN